MLSLAGQTGTPRKLEVVGRPEGKLRSIFFDRSGVELSRREVFIPLSVLGAPLLPFPDEYEGKKQNRRANGANRVEYI